VAGEHEIRGWFAGRLPGGWFEEAPDVLVDREEILVVGRLAEPVAARDDDAAVRRAACRGAIQRFREETRDARVRIALECERATERKVSWGARCGEEEQLFTHLSVPVMTRLRMPERRVLDTLVAAGVARSRSDALAWCVRLVGQHEADWIEQLREALVAVDEARAEGPSA
jgi:hypothetical protein